MSGINSSKFMQGGQNIRDFEGTHALELVSVEGGTTFKKREKFIAEFMVHRSTNEELQAKIEASGKPKALPDVQVMGEYPDYFYTDVRKFLAALLDVDATDDDFDWATAKEEAEAGKFNGCFLVADVNDTGKFFKSGARKDKPVRSVDYSPAPDSE